MINKTGLRKKAPREVIFINATLRDDFAKAKNIQSVKLQGAEILTNH